MAAVSSHALGSRLDIYAYTLFDICQTVPGLKMRGILFFASEIDQSVYTLAYLFIEVNDLLHFSFRWLVRNLRLIV